MNLNGVIDAQGSIGRRRFLGWAAKGLVASAIPNAFGAVEAAKENAVKLAPVQALDTEAAVEEPAPALAPEQRVGFAIVGLGHISVDQMLPAFGQSKYARPVAVVSGNRGKAVRIARQYGINVKAIYDYADFASLADNPEVRAVYIALPNSMHAEYTARAARAGKHVLCEKPMATTVSEGEQMIADCAAAHVQLMLAYRSQYEPFDRAVVKMVREGSLGRPLHFLATNSQKQGDVSQWRLKRKLAGGGPLPDVGIYCLNAARFLSGEEPVEVFGQTQQISGDPRFSEVESAVQFSLLFPSGFAATCNASYDSHRSQMFRLEGSDGWAELSPAFAYSGLKLRVGKVREGAEGVAEIALEAKNQFSLELDHMAECILQGRPPLTGGLEGLQDMKIMEAIYASSRSGKKVRLALPANVRGPDIA